MCNWIGTFTGGVNVTGSGTGVGVTINNTGVDVTGVVTASFSGTVPSSSLMVLTLMVRCIVALVLVFRFKIVIQLLV